MWHTQLPCDVFSTPTPTPLSSLCLFLRLWSLKNLSDCTYYYYGMPMEVCGCSSPWQPFSLLWGGCRWGMGRDCRRGRGELIIMVCTLQGNYAEWGRGDWSVDGGYYGMPAPWSFCVCMCTRGVCVRERGDGVGRTRCHKTRKYI